MKTNPENYEILSDESLDKLSQNRVKALHKKMQIIQSKLINERDEISNQIEQLYINIGLMNDKIDDAYNYKQKIIKRYINE